MIQLQEYPMIYSETGFVSDLLDQYNFIGKASERGRKCWLSDLVYSVSRIPSMHKRDTLNLYYLYTFLTTLLFTLTA